MPKPPASVMEPSPTKLVVEELDALRKDLRTVSSRYLAQLEEQIGVLRTRAVGSATDGKGTRIRELRDMLMLMRGLDLKPEAGRRKDLKKIEAALGELQLLSQKW